jgi:hypothetical protein
LELRNKSVYGETLRSQIGCKDVLKLTPCPLSNHYRFIGLSTRLREDGIDEIYIVEMHLFRVDTNSWTYKALLAHASKFKLHWDCPDEVGTCVSRPTI